MLNYLKTIAAAIGGGKLMPEPQNRFGYEAARPSLERPMVDDPLSQSDTPQDNYDRRQLMKESRSLFKNVSEVASAERLFRRYCIPRSWRCNSGDKDVDKMVTDYIALQMEAENFDYSEEHSAPAMWGQALIDMGVDGDSFIRLVRPRGERSFRCQGIRADLIGTTENARDGVRFGDAANPNQPNPNTRRQSIGGVLLDSRGRRTAYEKYRPAVDRMTSSGYSFERNIPKSSMLHIYDADHLDQVRGVTHWSTAINNIKDIHDIWKFEKSNQKRAASIAGVVQNEQGKAPTGLSRTDPKPGLSARTNKALALKKSVYDDCSDEDEAPKEKVDPNKPQVKEVMGSHLIYLKTNEEIKEYQNNRPGATFLEFTKYLIRSGSTSISLPYGVAYDASDLQGAPLRFEMSKANEVFKYVRLDIVEARMANPWIKAKLVEGIENGMLPRLRLRDIPKLKGEFRYAASATADELYQSQSFLKMSHAGFVSGSDIAELKGRTFSDVIQEREMELEIVYQSAKRAWEKSDKSLPIEFFIDRIASGPNPNGSVAYAMKDQIETPVPEDED